MGNQMNKSKHLTIEEAKRLKDSLASFINKEDGTVSMIEKRQCVALLWLISLGCRPSELLLIRWSDVTKQDDRLFVNITALKNSNNREIPLPKDASKYLDKLKMYSRVLNKGEKPSLDAFIFGFSYENLKRVWYKFRTVEKPLKALRHTRAIEIYKSKRDIHLTKYFLGHKNIQNTMIYVDYVESSKALLEAVDL